MVTVVRIFVVVGGRVMHVHYMCHSEKGSIHGSPSLPSLLVWALFVFFIRNFIKTVELYCIEQG